LQNGGSVHGLDQESEIPPLTLQRLVHIIVARWRVIVLIIAASFLFGIVYLHFAPLTYTVEMQVVATSGEEMGAPSGLGGGASLLSQFSGKTSGQQNNFELYLAGLQSIETARVLAQNPAFMHRMFASEWSERDKAWLQPFSVAEAAVRLVKRALGIYVAPWQPPDAIRLSEFLQGNVAVSRSLVSPVVTVSTQTGDRQFGVDLIYALHAADDGILRRRTLERETGYVQYLNGLIEKATIVEYRAALSDTIMQQEKVRMVAASSAPYAADMFARPTPSRIPTGPKGVLILLESIVIGLFIALSEAVLYDRLGVYRRLLSGPGRWLVAMPGAEKRRLAE
jgi:hypothetical protein